ncbi:MAG: KH domain-containing protein [Candidatus Dojkabacteria bacterium]
MKELLVHIIKAIVNYPDDVSVDERDSVDFPGLTILTIDVNESDKGVIIGRKGRTINSIRDIITISAIRNNKRVRVLLKDDRVDHHVDVESNVEVGDEDMLKDEI